MPATIKAAAFEQAVQLLPPKSDTGTTGTGVDLTGYEGLMLVCVHVGAASGSGVLKVTINDSTDNSTWAACNNFGPNANGTTANTSATGNQELIYTVDASQCRRYIQAVSSVVSGTSAILGVSLHPLKKVNG